MATVLCVTAFKDIRRGNWSGVHSEWKRTNENYIDWFANLAQSGVNIVCFCDEPEAQLIRDRTGFCKIYPYNEQDTFFKYLETERDIMVDEEYQRVLAHRIRHPEHSIPEYNMVQHSKTSFVRRASEMFPEYTHYAWVDFGYIRDPNMIPKNVVWEAIATDRIHYASFCAPPPQHILEPLPMCVHAPCILQGSMFVLPKNLALWYEKEYEKVLLEYHRLRLADDDQALALQVIKKYPQNFILHVLPDWFSIFDKLLRPLT